MKALLNPMIERMGAALTGVDQYADIFEKVALARSHRAAWRALFRRRLTPDVAAAPLLFIHVPKNGGTSVKRALYTSDPGHATVRYYDLFFPDHLAASETLAILRDPTDRFLSGFDFLMNRGGGDVRIQSGPLARMEHIRSVDDFLDFLEAARGDWLKVDTFARPQSWYIADIAGVIRVRHLWLIDRADEGLDTFLTQRGVAPLPHVNRTKRQSRSVTPEQLRRLERLYADDFRLYAELRRAGGYSTALVGTPVSASSVAATSASIAA